MAEPTPEATEAAKQIRHEVLMSAVQRKVELSPEAHTKLVAHALDTFAARRITEKDAEIAALRDALQEIADNGHNIGFPFVGRAKRALRWAAPPDTIPSKGDAQ